MILFKLRTFFAKRFIVWKYNNMWISPDYFPDMFKIRVEYLQQLRKDFISYSFNGDDYFNVKNTKVTAEIRKTYQMLIDNLTEYYTNTYKKANDLLHEYAHKRRILNYLYKHKKLSKEKQIVMKNLNEAFAKYVTIFEQFPPKPDIPYFIKLEKHEEMLKDMEDDFN